MSEIKQAARDNYGKPRLSYLSVDWFDHVYDNDSVTIVQSEAIEAMRCIAAFVFEPDRSADKNMQHMREIMAQLIKVASNNPEYLNRATCEAMYFGAEKYGNGNWLNGFPVTELCDAMLRHLQKIVLGENMDGGKEGTQAPHIGCVGFGWQSLMNVLSDTELLKRFDDRPDKANTGRMQQTPPVNGLFVGKPEQIACAGAVEKGCNTCVFKYTPWQDAPCTDTDCISTGHSMWVAR